MNDYHKRLQKETSAYRETPLQQCVPKLCHLEQPKFEPLAQKSFVLIQNQKQSDSDPEFFLQKRNWVTSSHSLQNAVFIRL